MKYTNTAKNRLKKTTPYHTNTSTSCSRNERIAKGHPVHPPGLLYNIHHSPYRIPRYISENRSTRTQTHTYVHFELVEAEARQSGLPARALPVHGELVSQVTHLQAPRHHPRRVEHLRKKSRFSLNIYNVHDRSECIEYIVS